MTRDTFFPCGETHISRDICFPGRRTNITRDTCFPGGGTQITRDISFPGGEHISLGICVLQYSRTKKRHSRL